MNGMNSYVLQYQDQAGNVFTSRVFTDNPRADLDEAYQPDLEEMLGKQGYKLLFVHKIEELGIDMESAQKVARKRRMVTFWRSALALVAVVTVLGLVQDAVMYDVIQKKLEASAAGDETFRVRLLDHIGHLEASIDQHSVELHDLDALAHGYGRWPHS